MMNNGQYKLSDGTKIIIGDCENQQYSDCKYVAFVPPGDFAGKVTFITKEQKLIVHDIQTCGSDVTFWRAISVGYIDPLSGQVNTLGGC